SGAHDKRLAAGAVHPHQRVFFRRAAGSPMSKLLGGRVRNERTQRRLEGVDDAKSDETLFLVVIEVVVGGVSAGELGAGVAGRDDPGTEDPRLARGVVQGAVHVPELVAAHVLRDGVVGTLRDRSDLGNFLVRTSDKLAETPTKGDLFLVVE